MLGIYLIQIKCCLHWWLLHIKDFKLPPFLVLSYAINIVAPHIPALQFHSQEDSHQW